MRKLLIVAFLCPALTHCMPPRNTKPPLSVGDAYQAFAVSNIINSTASSLKIPSTGNKVFIINFVSVACRSCFKDYARLEALQKQFDGYLQVLLVTSESPARVDSFLKTSKVGKALHLPIAVSDTLLSSWFPHRYVSHTVWLQNGVVKGITDPQYVDENNIQILLLGHQPRWPVKADTLSYNTKLPMLAFNTQTLDASNAASPFYSAFSPCINGLAPAFYQTTDSVTASVKTTILNLPLIQCFLHAYNLPYDFPLSQLVLNVSDSSRYIYNESRDYKLAWDAQNSFCYESVLPSSLTAAQQQQKIISDLDFFSGLHSCFRKIKAACFALKTCATTDAKPLLTSGTSPAFISLSNLIWYINHHWYGIPAFNETGISERRYIPFSETVFSSFGSLQPYLKQYGLHLTFTEREVEMLSLSELDTNGSQ